jgi:hypothetical protein
VSTKSPPLFLILSCKIKNNYCHAAVVSLVDNANTTIPVGLSISQVVAINRAVLTALKAPDTAVHWGPYLHNSQE